ncbi:MAG: cobalamin-dependent protein [Candidatus Heimdallarchaeota archaeon]|nr:cobalamin-dependent protein [Candidatus Heimdallarchaeota archaeon]
MKFDNNQKVLFVVHDLYQAHNQFPLGIAYLAAVLRKNGIDVRIYCQDVYHYSNEELVQYLQENEFDLICLGFLAARFVETVIDLSKIINRHKKNAWFVLGGQGPSPIPEYILRRTSADIVVMGEGETTILDILKAKENEIFPFEIKGIAYKDGDHIEVNPRRLPIQDLDTIPFPE